MFASFIFIGGFFVKFTSNFSLPFSLHKGVYPDLTCSARSSSLADTPPFILYMLELLQGIFFI